MEAKVSDVLRHKGDRVVTLMPQQTVAAAVQLLTKNRIGAAPVVDEGGRVVGIVSERDIIRGMSEDAGALLALPVDQLMTREVKTCVPEDRLVDLMRVMTLQRIRHLPVVHSGALCGIVSIGDVVKQRLEEVQSEVEDLHRYIRSP
ncbi:MAG TPA: CBS domain-containing protein [Candidatus Binataceae bacterium]